MFSNNLSLNCKFVIDADEQVISSTIIQDVL